MLDEGIRGEFEESKYDESELSKVESKWKRFLQDSAMAKQNLETEKANIKGLISDISHQTKTPMANIKLYSELLSEQLEEDGMEAELLGHSGTGTETGIFNSGVNETFQIRNKYFRGGAG